MQGNYEISVYGFITVLLLLTAFAGYKTGFIKGFFTLIKFVFSILTAYAAYELTGGFVLWVLPSVGDWLYPLSFLVTCLVTCMVITILLIPLKELTSEWHYQKWNKVLGIIPGLMNGIVVSMFLLQTVSFITIPGKIEKAVFENPVVASLMSCSNPYKEKLIPVFEKPFRQTISAANEANIVEDAVNLSFVTNIYVTRYDLESEMLSLINIERSKYGLNPLVEDVQLTVLARKHSADMFQRGYFSHNTPEGITPFDRMHQAGINYITAGENLALSPSLSLAHTGLMNSPGHRANILNPKYHKVGIGVLDGGEHGFMISQEFRN